jgi:hypothetical protein
MTVTLSTDVILENIYAASALYTITNQSDKHLPLLHRDHRSALLRVIEEAFSNQIMQMLPHVQSFAITDSSLVMELDDEFGSTDSSPAELLQTIITSRALAAVWINIDLKRSQTYSTRADLSTKALLKIATIAHPFIRQRGL